MSHFKWILFVVMSAGMFSISAQQPGEMSYSDNTTFPEGTFGERVQAFLNAFNSNQGKTIQDFLEKQCTEQFQGFVPMEDHLRIFADFYRRSGGLDFHSVRSYEPPRPGETVLILKDRTMGGWHAVTLMVPHAESKIDGIMFSPARAPQDITMSSLSKDQMISELRTMVEKACSSDVFSGAVLVAQGDEVLFEKACGEASKRFNVTNKIDTKFNLGSMNKMFTGVAIIQLVEAGNLSLDQTIDQFLDETWLAKDVSAKITVEHLLTHRSGLGSYFNDTYWKSSRLLFRELDDYKPLIKDEKPAFTPGSQWQYSNTGMFLLGVIIEKVSGENYFDYMRKHLYQPAGMQNTDCYDMDKPVPNLAIGYIPESDGHWRNNIYDHVVRGGPAGGGFSTVRDLHRFARALQNGVLLSKESTAMLWTDHHGDGYGFGFGLEDHPIGKVVGHSGGFPGLNSKLDIFLDNGYVVAVMANYSGAASPVARGILELIKRVE
ncbi:MAG: beta-lactamase family protein [Saprospiraceae bacterium]|nr:beta-lactamase family protein [Saprospiraceae bacterium]